MTTVVLALVSFVACGSDATEKSSGAEVPGSQSSPTDSASNTVTMRLIAFRPDVTQVPAGTEVTWKQEDPGVHTVTSGVVEQQPGGVSTRPDGQFDSGEVQQGAAFSLVLDRPGRYPYFCSIHPSTMRGQLEIT